MHVKLEQLPRLAKKGGGRREGTMRQKKPTLVVITLLVLRGKGNTRGRGRGVSVTIAVFVFTDIKKEVSG